MHTIELIAAFRSIGWLPLADAIAKATLLFVVAGLASVALRKAAAATRHLVWTLALVSAVALPVLSIALPRWQLPLVTLSSPAVHRDRPALNAVPLERTAIMPMARTSHPRAMPGPDAGSEGVARRPLAFPGNSSGMGARPVSWPRLIFALWALGAGLILLRLVAGWLGVQWLSRRTERVTAASWLPLARSLASRLGVSRRVMFLRTGEASMPMAWGILRPAVLMPVDADAWPAERLRIVLLHELAHVKRRDCLTHMVGQLACALYWFNPLAWVAVRHLRMERERACDDLVLEAGTRGADYADQLLQMARVARGGRFPALFAGASLAMAQRSQLEGRLLAILDPKVPRSGVSRLRTAAATSLFACALMPLATVQPWAFATPAAQAVIATEAPASAVAERQPADGAAVAPPVPMVPTSVALPAAPAPPQGPSSPAVASNSPVPAAAHVRASVEATVPSIVQGVLAEMASTAADAQAPEIAGSHADHGRSRQADPKMVAALTAALKDIDKDVRETALQALVQLRDPAIFEPLLQALTDAAADVREHAAFGLGQMRDKRAVEPLTRALKDQNGDVREQAAFALGQIRDRSAVAGLMAALKDSDDDVREQAVFALGQLRDPAAVDALAAATRDGKPDVRQQAVFALGQLRDPRSIEPLVSALKDADADVRQQAAFALGQIRERGSVEALIIALKDSIPDVREQVAFALGQIRDPRALDALTAALKDANVEVRRQAAFALGQLAR
jgi:HEAT repeat protein/beta-lactamase regulating signal transducer with metallopeptidase domain